MSDPRRPYQLQSPVLKKHGLTVARYCFERCYATWPELEERYGRRGRHYTAEDNFWHLDHLDTAAALDAPELFEEYADWLVGLLGARGMGREYVAGAFGFLAEAIERADCPPRQEAHRGALVAILRGSRSRILAGRRSDPATA